jgi:Rod binding domain-containing protein
MDLAPAFSPPVAPVEAQSAEQLAKRGQIEKTAKDFEASFLSVMLGQMFKDVGAEAPFSGGHGEAAFKSFLGEAMAKQMVQHGGVGLADRVAKEMLKLQGLS